MFGAPDGVTGVNCGVKILQGRQDQCTRHRPGEITVYSSDFKAGYRYSVMVLWGQVKSLQMVETFFSARFPENRKKGTRIVCSGVERLLAWLNEGRQPNQFLPLEWC